MTATVQPAPLPKQRFCDSNGNPLAGGKLFTYTAGTVSKQNTYTDSTGTTPNPNPVILDSRGEAAVWPDTTLAYKYVLAPSTDTDPPSSPIWTIDGIPATPSLGSLAATTSANQGAGLVGFLYSLGYGVGTVGAWLQGLATSAGAGFVGFLHSSSNSVLRTIASKLSDTICAFDFMTAAQIADVKGRTFLVDVSTALDNFSTALAVAGGSGFMPPGGYKRTTAWALNSATGGYEIHGAAPQWSTVSGQSGGTEIRQLTVGVKGIVITAAQNGQIVVRNLGVTGNGTSGNLIEATGAYSTFIEKVFASNGGAGGIIMNACFDSHVEKCSIGNVQQTGLLWNGLANAITARDNLLFNCDMSHGGYACMTINGTGGNSLVPVIEGNTFEGGANTEFGLAVTGCNGLNLRGNYFEIIPTLLYMDQTVSGFDIQGNYFQDGLVTIQGSTWGNFSSNVLQKVSVTTAATLAPPAGGGSNVHIGQNLLLGGATISFPPRSGQATLVAGTVTVNNTEVVAGQLIMLTRASPGGTIGDLTPGTIVAGTSFVIHSASASDTSTVYWSFAVQ